MSVDIVGEVHRDLHRLMGRGDIPDDARTMLGSIAARLPALETPPLTDRSAFEQMVELNPYAMAILDGEGRWVRGNRAFAQLFASVPPPEYRLFADPIALKAGLGDALARLRSGEVITVPELWYDVQAFMPERPSCRVCICFVLFPLLDHDGALQHVVGMYENITSRKTSEENQVRSERLAAVGTLAAGVAHEFNNINTQVVGFAELLLETGCLDEAQQSFLRRIVEAARRTRDLTRDMLTFAGQQRTPRDHARLDKLAEGAMALIAREFEANGVRLERRLDAVPATLLSRSDVAQVVLNLLLNARHAVMGQPERRVRVETGSDEESVWLRVTDTGCGIPVANRGRIFSPFYSTKGEFAPEGSALADEPGTGLGLAVSLSIARAHGGDLTVESRLDVGSTFQLTLPIRRPAAPELTDEPTPLPTASLEGRMVVVLDDDPDIRFIIEHTLLAEGCKVRCSDDGAQVLGWILEGGVDAVVADVIMPKMSGLELFQSLVGLDEALRPAYLFISGLPSRLRSQDLSNLRAVEVLGKPFGRVELTTALRLLLGRKVHRR